MLAVSCKKDTDEDPVPAVKVDSYSIGTTTYSINHEKKTVTIKDNGTGTGTKTFSADTTYVLQGMVFVNSGSVLTIEAGTVVKGLPGEAENASALIVARGAKIMANGTAEKPIIFTAESDDLNKSLSFSDRGLWGGLILLGNAKINTVPNMKNIEGIPTTETRGEYGGTDDADNSGVLTYVSIRHGGTNIGADNEINGLTLGAIGSGTKIEYIEVIANNDDGIEFFGGTVDIKNAVIAYCADDSYDWDQGYRGRGQFWLAVQSADIASDRLGELDGADLPEDGLPFGGGTIYNATLIGAGEAAAKRTLTFRANGGGAFFNSVFANQAKGVDIEHKPVAQDSYKRLVDGQLKVEYNVFDGVAGGKADKLISISYSGSFKDKVTDSTEAKTKVAEYAAKANNVVAATGIVATLAGFNPVPTGNVANVTSPSDAYFTKVSYNGAFAPNGTNWAKGWTRLFQ